MRVRVVLKRYEGIDASVSINGTYSLSCSPPDKVSFVTQKIA
jgi:hypothetical protein